mmetsp:Transcript_11979/g.25366  ORF Transcript_11979/g.25366 Transcript_11979/m.25366 type:complete len:83 (-) Transcript_11979:32-280(-)
MASSSLALESSSLVASLALASLLAYYFYQHNLLRHHYHDHYQLQTQISIKNQLVDFFSSLFYSFLCSKINEKNIVVTTAAAV